MEYMKFMENLKLWKYMEYVRYKKKIQIQIHFGFRIFKFSAENCWYLNCYIFMGIKIKAINLFSFLECFITFLSISHYSEWKAKMTFRLEKFSKFKHLCATWWKNFFSQLNLKIELPPLKRPFKTCCTLLNFEMCAVNPIFSYYTARMLHGRTLSL